MNIIHVIILIPHIKYPKLYSVSSDTTIDQLIRMLAEDYELSSEFGCLQDEQNLVLNKDKTLKECNVEEGETLEYFEVGGYV